MATATYNAVVDFSGSSTSNDATALRIYTAASGGTLLWTISGITVAALAENQFYRVASGNLSLSLAAGSDGAQDAFAQLCMREALENGSNVFAELYNGSTSISDREALTASDWDIT